MARRHYSDEDKAAALAALRANAGNVARTARQVGVPEPTLRQWAKGLRAAPPAQLSERKKADLADRMEEIARALLDRVTPERMDDATVQQLLTSAGIAIDKMRLLRNQPTENVASLVLIEQIVDADSQQNSPAAPGAGVLPPV